MIAAQIATYQSLNTGQISLDGSVDEEVQQPIGVERSAPPVLSFYGRLMMTIQSFVLTKRLFRKVARNC